jgi:hypothetical protein
MKNIKKRRRLYLMPVKEAGLDVKAEKTKDLLSLTTRQNKIIL